MGIDVYLHEVYERDKARYEPVFNAAVAARDKAPDGPKREKLQKKVNEAFDAMMGAGYLREAYHGGPYVTKHLVREGWSKKKVRGETRDGIPIPAMTLRKRLPAAVLLAIYREHVVYAEDQDPGHVVDDGNGSAVAAVLSKVFASMGGDGQDEAELVKAMTFEQLKGAAELIASGKVPEEARQFVDFVKAAEEYEALTGKPARVRVSY